MKRASPGGSLVRAATAAFVLVVCGAPLGVLVVQALGAAEDLPILLGSAGPWRLLLRSMGLAAAVTLGTLALGLPMAAVLARGRIRGARTLLALHALPMFLPPLIPALGWFHLLGGVHGRRWLFGEIGVVLVLTFAFTPVVTALVALALRALDPPMVESGQVVASARRVLLRLELPAVWPAAVLGALLVFALSLSEVAVPMFLRVDVYPAVVLTRLGGVAFAPGEAAALCLPLVLVVLALLTVERGLLGSRSYATLGLRRRTSPRVALPAPARAFAVLLAAVSVAPLLALGWRSLDGGYAGLGMWLGDAPWNTLRAAWLAATAMTAVALVVGHGLARGRAWARGLDLLLLLGFFLPAAALGVGLIGLWHRPQTQAIYGSFAIIVLGYLARYTVVSTRTVAVAVRQTSVSFEEAARVMGAGEVRRLLRVVLPMHARALGAAWLLGLVFAMRDVETAILYVPPGGEPLTVRIFTLEANGGDAVVAALAMTQLGLTAGALGVGALLLARRSP